MPRTLLVLCPNPVGARMAGLGIRYSEIARALADGGVSVTLAAPEIDDAQIDGVQLRAWPPDGVRALRELLAGVEAVLAPPGAPHVMRELRRCGARIAIDLYDPVVLEVLERHAGGPAAARAAHVTTTSDQLADALRTGGFFVCASERQRDLWIGALLARGRITPPTYDRDPTLRGLIDVVAFGIPAAPPPAGGGDAIRARFPQIAGDERVVLWNGGLWRWLDAPTAIRAVGLVRARGDAVRLVFMGASTAGGAGEALAEAQRVVAEEGLDDAVLFNDAWVPYVDRAHWLGAADAVISTHRDHLETRYAFRTRLLDCLWAGVPAVVTGGDELAARIAAGDLGAVADPGDVDGVAAGIERVLERGRASYAPALRAVAHEFEWPRIVAPLRAFVDGGGGGDRGDGDGGRRGRGEGRRRHALAALITGPEARSLRRAAQRLTRLVRAARRG